MDQTSAGDEGWLRRDPVARQAALRPQRLAVRLARYKQPAHVRIVDALPRTASGKVRKDELRQAFAGPA